MKFGFSRIKPGKLKSIFLFKKTKNGKYTGKKQILSTRARNPWRLGLYGILLLSLLAFLIWGYFYTGNPNTCSACHELKPDFLSYKKSLHAEIPCYSCHAKKGFLAAIGARFGLVKDLYVHLTGKYRKPLNSDLKLAGDIADENCEVCHSPKRTVSPRRGVLIDHKTHKKKNIPCVRCHNRVAHPLDLTKRYVITERIAESVPYRDGTKMASCMECHVGGVGNPPNRCETCHPQQFELPYSCSTCHTGKMEALKPQSHFAPNYTESIHESLAKSRPEYCYQCHLKSYCDSCHVARKVSVSLPAAGKKKFHKPKLHYDPQFLPPLHGDQAKKQGKEVCFQCHTEKFCNDCHMGLQMPHPQGFLAQHGQIMQKLGFRKSCARCHQNRNIFCESGCHHKGWNPSLGPLNRSHPQVVQVNGVGYCFTCHTPVFCAVCHVSGKKTRMFRE